MTRYRLHINGEPTNRTCPRQHAYEWAAGWQWLPYDHAPEYCMTAYVRCNGERIPCNTAEEMHGEHVRRIRSGLPVGMQLVGDKRLVRAA